MDHQMASKKKANAPKKNQSCRQKLKLIRNLLPLPESKSFSHEVKAEFNKIVWPDKKVTIGSTGVVIVLVFVISIYLGAVDLSVGKLVSYILR